jgi:hypothetical protein
MKQKIDQTSLSTQKVPSFDVVATLICISPQRPLKMGSIAQNGYSGQKIELPFPLPCVLPLNGFPGVGKLTIAKSISQHLHTLLLARQPPHHRCCSLRHTRSITTKLRSTKTILESSVRWVQGLGRGKCGCDFDCLFS